MTPDPDTLAKQREQLAKRRALRASIPEEVALEAAAAAKAGASPANSSRGSSEGAAIAEAAAAMAAGDPTHPATLFASCFTGTSRLPPPLASNFSGAPDDSPGTSDRAINVLGIAAAAAGAV